MARVHWKNTARHPRIASTSAIDCIGFLPEMNLLMK